jgi:cation transport protein ChaC
MWVFGYGSLMWDGWEATRGCARKAKAEIRGYQRAFNKKSIHNWGSKSRPCPTLNLVKLDGASCRGLAFEFPEDRKEAILNYLVKREGKDFKLCELPVQLEQENQIAAVVPIYSGPNLIPADSADKVAEMVLKASGLNGTCLRYVTGIADRLRELEIEDPVATELCRVVARQKDSCGKFNAP